MSYQPTAGYQLLAAVQLRLTLHEDHSADLWLSNLAVRSSAVVSDLNSMKLVCRVEHTVSKEWPSKQSRTNSIDMAFSPCLVGHDSKNCGMPAPCDLMINIQKDSWSFSRGWDDSTVNKFYRSGPCGNMCSISVSEMSVYGYPQRSEKCPS